MTNTLYHGDNWRINNTESLTTTAMKQTTRVRDNLSVFSTSSGWRSFSGW